jgi:predicted transglutaminase-like cysteine proteinase
VAGGVVGFLMLLVIGGIIIANLGSDNTASNTGNKNAGNTPANVSRTINFPASTNSDKILTRTFKWSYRGRSYAFTVNIPDAQYQAARAAVRPVIKTSTGATIQPVRDAGIDLVAKGLYEEANKASYDHMKTLEFVATFVQKLPYTSDKATTGYDEYPRYPVETLVDNGGDCEDTALLAAVLLKSMGYDTVLVNPPGHMAVAVLGGFDFYGTFFSYQGGKYYYLETTGEGWPVGDLPPEYKNTKVLIYTLK